jgi:ornithine cyclodeaminase/alanine dehydrogenase-like protein (mu-crystallin family)
MKEKEKENITAFSAVGMALEDIMLSEMSQKDISARSHL